MNDDALCVEATEGEGRPDALKRALSLADVVPMFDGTVGNADGDIAIEADAELHAVTNGDHEAALESDTMTDIVALAGALMLLDAAGDDDAPKDDEMVAV